MRDLKTLWIFEANQAHQENYKFLLDSFFEIVFFDHPRLGLIEFLKGPKPDLILSDSIFEGKQGQLIQWIHDFSPVDIWLITNDTSMKNLETYQTVGITNFYSKNFDPNILLIKIENHFLKKQQHFSMTELKIGNHTIKDLTRTQYKIIELFLDRKNREISREEFQKKIWGDQVVHHKNLNVQFHLLRKKLKPYQFTINSTKPGYWCLSSQKEAPSLQI